jgi:hypothetical protein
LRSNLCCCDEKAPVADRLVTRPHAHAHRLYSADAIDRNVTVLPGLVLYVDACDLRARSEHGRSSSWLAVEWLSHTTGRGAVVSPQRQPSVRHRQRRRETATASDTYAAREKDAELRAPGWKSVCTSVSRDCCASLVRVYRGPRRGSPTRLSSSGVGAVATCVDGARRCVCGHPCCLLLSLSRSLSGRKTAREQVLFDKSRNGCLH